MRSRGGARGVAATRLVRQPEVEELVVVEQEQGGEGEEECGGGERECKEVRRDEAREGEMGEVPLEGSAEVALGTVEEAMRNT